ncbi:coenzyme Q-binding protein COQ10, mitochondrial [Cladorrhinum sp. PSN332]|nr:coenzyme Q-binding protein COQ10, mitochondrial [Cladorrhinum sp. PSN332]
MALKPPIPTRAIPPRTIFSTLPPQPSTPVRSAALLLRPPPPPPSLPPSSRRPFSSTPTPKFLSSLLSSTTSTALPASKILTATKTLPYPASKIYALISDIDSYSSFLPHCTHSLVTSFTSTDPPLPSLGDLTVGYGPLTQSYTSRVYCIPDPKLYIVEAVSGNAETSIPSSVLKRYGYNDQAAGENKTDGGIFEKLVTRWEVRPAQQQQQQQNGDAELAADVRLRVTFRFANPLLGLAAGGVADMKVDEMVEAFEGRARRLFGNPWNKGGKPTIRSR